MTRNNVKKVKFSFIRPFIHHKKIESSKKSFLPLSQDYYSVFGNYLVLTISVRSLNRTNPFTEHPSAERATSIHSGFSV